MNDNLNEADFSVIGHRIDNEPELLEGQKNYNCEGIQISNTISVYFRDMEKNLINKIKKATYLVGCIACFTNNNIIEAMLEMKGVSIIVNKDINLKMDSRPLPMVNFTKLRGFPLDSNMPESRVCSSDLLYTSTDSGKIDPVRCVSVSDKRPNMHNKFLVFLQMRTWIRILLVHRILRG